MGSLREMLDRASRESCELAYAGTLYHIAPRLVSEIEAELLAPLTAQVADLEAKVERQRKNLNAERENTTAPADDLAEALAFLESKKKVSIAEAVRDALAPVDAEESPKEALDRVAKEIFGGPDGERILLEYLGEPVDDEDDALTAYAEDMGAPADADPMNAMNAHSERIEQHEARINELRVDFGMLDDQLSGETYDLHVRLDEHDESLTFISGWGKDMQKRIDEMNDRMDEENEAGSMRLLYIEKRLDELAARVDNQDLNHEVQAVSWHDLKERVEALEAARQEPPQPTPSAPEVARMTRALMNSLRDIGHNVSLSEAKRAIDAAFAARDREVQG